MINPRAGKKFNLDLSAIKQKQAVWEAYSEIVIIFTFYDTIPVYSCSVLGLKEDENMVMQLVYDTTRDLFVFLQQIRE